MEKVLNVNIKSKDNKIGEDCLFLIFSDFLFLHNNYFFTSYAGLKCTLLLKIKAIMIENARIPMFPQICTGDVETSNTKTESAAIIMDAMQIAFNFPLLT